MLERVEVRNVQGDLFKLNLEQPDGYVVEDIGGLGPVKANLVSTGYATRDGELHQSSKRGSRNITMKLEIAPDPETETVWGLRQKLYDFFMPKAEIVMQYFLLSGLVLEIPGVVESCEPDHFTQEPMMNISIMCFSPVDFYEPAPEVLEGLLTTDEDYLEFDYKGTTETGIIFSLEVDRSMDEFTIYHRLPNGQVETMTYDNAPLEAGDVLTISTIPGSKGATLNRGGVQSSVLYGISPQSRWTELKRGTNGIKVYATGDPLPVTIEYVNHYGGL